MPIKPGFRWYYPIDWQELSVVVRCEDCWHPHGQITHHFGDGR